MNVKDESQGYISYLTEPHPFSKKFLVQKINSATELCSFGFCFVYKLTLVLLNRESFGEVLLKNSYGSSVAQQMPRYGIFNKDGFQCFVFCCFLF